MKYYLILIGLIVGGLTVAFFTTVENKVGYTSHHSTSTVEVHPEWATDADAVKAAQDVIKKKELEAELDGINVEIDSLEQRKIELEKELDQY